MSIPPDDPRLTEYALGEMNGDAAKELEAAMAQSPTTFDEIHEIRGAAAAACEALSARPPVTLTDTQRHRILRLAEAPAPESLLQHPKNVVHTAFWTWFARSAAGVAAAAIAVACLVLAYQSGYKKAVVDTKKPPAKGSVSADDPLPGETPSIRIHVVDPEGEPQQVASRPLSPDSVLPVGKGREDALVSAVPKVHSPPSFPPDPIPDTGSKEVPETESPEGDPIPEGRLPVVVDSGQLTPSPVMENPFVEVSSSPRSSFPLRAGAASYASAAGSIRGTGRLPDPSTIAVEEIVNAFDYSVPGFVPTSSYDHPFAAGAEVFSCPWEPGHRLVRVTVKAAGPKGTSAAEPPLIAEEIELLVEFNRTRAARYRLIGFDGAGILSAVSAASPKARSLRAGETVTALYEVVPAEGTQSDELRYTPHNFAAPPRDHGHELLCLSISYKDVSRALPDPEKSLVVPVIDPALSWNRSSGDFQWAAATAAFGMILTGSEHTGEFDFEEILALGERALRYDRNPDPRRTDFLDLVRRSVHVPRR